MSDEKISVIVPVYQVERYLEQSITSILNQTYQNLEIILIDDGSKDNSGKICDDFAKADVRIKVIHKDNGGLSSARNIGLKEATGEWFSFVDSDDCIKPDMLECMYKSVQRTQANMAVIGIEYVSEDKKTVKEYIPKDKVLFGEPLVEYFFKEGAGTEYFCNKLFHRTLFENIEFPYGRIYEDTFTLPKILHNAKCVFVAKIGYSYFQRKVGISRNFNILSQMDALDAKLYKLEFIKLNYPNLIPYAKAEVVETCCWLLYKIDTVSKKDYRKQREVVLKAFHNEKVGAVYNKRVISYLAKMISISPDFYTALYRIYDKLIKKY